MDYGDLPLDEQDSSTNRTEIYNVVADVVTNNSVSIVFGGDDSVPIPMLQAMECTGKQYTVLQIDAHIDWRDSHMGESPAGIIHGLASISRREFISQWIFFSRRILIDICKRKNSLWNQGSSEMSSIP